MKLHRLELAGFGPFRERQVVDFDAFDGDGVFLIAGRTGAGKSSILDGVSFALYGSVPRYDGGEKRLRSDHCDPDDPTEVVLEFTVGQTRWRVTRAPEYQRPARRGGGLTTEPTRAEAEELVGDEWVGRAAKPRDVALLLDEVLGLNAQQFQQVILLAQNRFSRFLLAKNEERQTLLRTLFGTRRFEDYENALEERRKDAQKRLDAAGERTRTLLDMAERLGGDGAPAGDEAAPVDLPGRRDFAERSLQRAEYRVEALTHERSTADAAYAAAAGRHAAAVTQAKSHAALESARAQLAALEADAPRIAADRTALERALAAEALRAPIDMAERAARADRLSTADAVTARDQWTRAGGEAAITTAELETLVDALTGQLAVWGVAAAQERGLAAKESALAALETRIAALVADLALLDEQRAQLPAERGRLEGALAASAAHAARRDDLRVQHDALRTRLVAAHEAESLAAQERWASDEYARCNAAAVAAASVVTSLLQRRLAGYAGELAAGLADGDPCAVCGSTAHPHPAAPDAQPVTDADLAAAEAARDAAAAAERRAGEASREARERLAEATARAGGADAPALAEQLSAASAALAAAEDAEAERARLSALLDDLGLLDAESATAREQLVATLAAEREAAAASAAAVAAIRVDVDTAKGSYPSVAARVDAATEQRDAARRCLAADAAAAETARAAETAATDLAALVSQSAFADADEVTAALLDDGARTVIAARIADHAAALTGTRARALELELETAGDIADPDAVAIATAAMEAADAARAAAIAAERDAVNAAAGVRDLLVRVDAAYADVATLAGEAAVVTRLADTVAGRAPNTKKMDLETFVLAAELEEIVAAANLRLAEMSSGRYALRHSDARAARGGASGLGIEVLDAHTGQLRPAQSLSGGETFLASLALALGLAEVVTGRAGGLRLDTLFVDEGFGSLDPETLELAMRTLDELRAGGRTVGVISHVEAMREQLPAQLGVVATPQGPSIIQQHATAARG